MSYLLEKCTFRKFNPSLIEDGIVFSCGDEDLDDFFLKDAFLQENQLLVKTIVLCQTKTLDSNIYSVLMVKKRNSEE